MLLIMNSAMMPQPGSYTARAVSFDEWREVVLAAMASGPRGVAWESYIGYSDNVRILADLGIPGVPVNRAEATLRPGDVMAVMRLKYRITDPSQKGRFTPKPEDFEWLLVEYHD